jgi:hypothetical protein
MEKYRRDANIIQNLVNTDFSLKGVAYKTIDLYTEAIDSKRKVG